MCILDTYRSFLLTGNIAYCKLLKLIWYTQGEIQILNLAWTRNIFLTLCGKIPQLLLYYYMTSTGSYMGDKCDLDCAVYVSYKNLIYMLSHVYGALIVLLPIEKFVKHFVNLRIFFITVDHSTLTWNMVLFLKDIMSRCVFV